MKTFLRYLWRIASSVLQLAIIAFVFSRLESRTEVIVVSILGLIYTTIRSIQLLQGIALGQIGTAFARELMRIQELLGEEREIIQEKRKELNQGENALMGGGIIVTGTFLTLVSLLCLYMLFDTLLAH
jgi:hypothetical protein